MILEVSRKQEYIFSSKRLRDNSARSNEIAYVTSSDFFQEVAGDIYHEAENFVYAGGGHTVLQFPDQKIAAAFARRVTKEAMLRYDGMEMFVKQRVYRQDQSPAENLNHLTEDLEAKKALRASSFRQLSFGVEALDPVHYQPCREDMLNTSFRVEVVTPPDGIVFPSEFQELAGDENFIAVVHVDGNAMGKRVQALYQHAGGGDWSACCQSLRRFSEGIQADFEDAFRKTVDILVDKLELPGGGATVLLPIRPVILAGDDVCFVTRGSLGLECARIFIEQLTNLYNQEDKLPYAACAGVSLVHLKYPFHLAYDLAEALCSSAKKFGAELDESGTVSAIDWHIEFGQLKGSLSDIREDYATEDGRRMELRPVVVTAPEDVSLEKTGGVRTYGFFKAVCQAMQQEVGNTARGKLKEFRTALKQGKTESIFFLRNEQIMDLLDHIFTSQFRTWREQKEQYCALIEGKFSLPKEPFLTVDGVSRSLFFDAIEMIDHFTSLEEVILCEEK